MDVRRALRQIWTLAAHSVLQAVRMKVVVVLIAFLFVLVPALPFLLKTDQTHLGQVRMVITYSIYLISFLLSVLTLFLSAITLNTEIKHQYIFLLDPKPVRRGVLLAGKWLGVMLIDVALLVAMLGTTYGLVRYLGRQWKNEGPRDYESFRVQALTARRALKPPLPADLEERIQEEYRQLEANNQLPSHKTKEWVLKQIRGYAKQSAWLVPAGASEDWLVKGVPLDLASREGWISIKIKHYGAGGNSTYEIPGEFVFNARGERPVSILQRVLVASPREFAVPNWTVRPDAEDPGVGVLQITYNNRDRQGVGALFPYEDGIQVLYPAATLGENFVRSGLVMLIQLGLIAMIGIFASTFLSFPVAVLFSMVVFAVGHMANFLVYDMLQDLYLFGSSMTAPDAPLNWGDEALRNVLKGFFSLFPNFSKHDVVPWIANGLLLPAGQIGWTFLMLGVVRGGALAVLGWYFFSRRELAALTSNS